MVAASWRQLVEETAAQLKPIVEALAPRKKPRGPNMRRLASLVCGAATVALTIGVVFQASAGNVPAALLCGLAALVNAFLSGACSDAVAEKDK